MPQTCLHALCQHAHVGDLLRVDDFVAIDEGQVGLWCDIGLPAESLKVLCTLLCHQVLSTRCSKTRLL